MLPLRKSKDLIHHTEEEAFSVLFQLIIYACMLITSTTLVLSTQDTYMFQFDSLINRIFVKRSLKSDFYNLEYNNIVTTAEWYDFLENTFLKYWHNQEAAHAEDGTDLDNLVFLKENFHIGVIRLRQIRVKPNTCIIHDVLNRYFNSCYVRYAEMEEETTKEHKGSYFHNFKEFPVEKINARFTKYTGPGYVVYFPGNQMQDEELLKNLKAMKWVDRGTRLLLIEFVLYNSNMNMFINTKFVSEVLATGTMVSSYEVEFLPIYCIWSITKPMILFTATVFYALVLFYTSEEIWFFQKYGLYSYVTGKWNLLDCAILVTAYISLTLSMIHPFRVNKRLNTVLKNEHREIFIDDLCYFHHVYKLCLAFCAIFVWLKIFRFISFNVTMLHFAMAIRRSTKDILGFAVMFFIVFLAYSLLGLLLFSDMNPGFSSFPNAIVTMMRMIMGDYQYQNIEKANNILGPIFFISYILFIFFILLNMFLAIISDTYMAVTSELTPTRSGFHIRLLRMWFNIRRLFLKCCCRKKHDVSETPSMDSPRSITHNEALKEYYGSAESSLGDFSKTPSLDGTNTATEFDRITHKVDNLEFEFENLIQKLDRVMQKVDARVNQQKEKRGPIRF